VKVKPPAEEESCNKEGFGYVVFYLVVIILIIWGFLK
jgi:hypothetical protein